MLKFLDKDAEVEIFICEGCGCEHFVETEIYLNDEWLEVCTDCDYLVIQYESDAM